MKKCVTIFKLLLTSAIILLSIQLKSQTKDFEKGLFNNWSINANIGNSQYFGDISNSSNPFSLIKDNTAWAYGVMASKQLTPVFGIRGQFIKGKLKGRKDNYTNGAPANLEFEADYFELNFNTSIDLFNIIMDYKSDRLFNLYGVFGIGLSNFQGQTKNYKTNTLIRSFGHDQGGGIGGWEVDGMLYGGGGAKIRISNSFDATAEMSLKFIGNDQLDGAVGGFKYDLYSYNCIGITYKFGQSEKKKKVIYEEPKIIETEPTQVEVIKEEPKIIEPVKIDTVKEVPVILETQNIIPEILPVATVNNEFKVQVMASKTKVDPAFIQKKFGITDTIREDYDGIWYRYSVGSFQEFWKAKEEAKKLISKNKVYGAFVVGFKDGKRLNSFMELLSADEKKEIQSTLNNVNQATSNIGLYYRIQVIALNKKMADETLFKQKYQITQEIYEEFINNLYVYTVGNETDYAKAVDLKNQIKKSGITDAFIVTFKNNKRVSIIEAGE